MGLFQPEMYKAFEESIVPTLMLDIERHPNGTYKSHKTGNMFLAFVYGWYRGEGVLKSFSAFMAEAKGEHHAT